MELYPEMNEKNQRHSENWWRALSLVCCGVY